jgi:excisionase family DNA binding protein
MKTYLKVSEIAEILEAGETSVRRWIIQGKLKAYRTGGGQYRIKKEDFEKFQESLSIVTPTNSKLGEI